MTKPPLLRLKNISYHMMVTLCRGLQGLSWFFTPVLVLATLTTLAAPVTTQTAQAASLNTLNFQARLQTNPGGAIVPDGLYNIEFKLYNTASSSGSSQGSCTGDANCLWTETRYDSNGVTAGNDNRVRVSHGYLTANLGSIATFPSTINWDQDLFITMNIGGSTQTATPTWNGEMNPRLQLTAVPYAFRAGQLARYNSASGFTSTLGFVAPTVGNQTFQIRDQAAAGTYNLCIEGSANCGFAAASGSSNYIQNTTVASLQTGASLAIQSAADANVTAYLQGRTNQSVATLSIKQGSSQTGDALSIVDNSNNPLFKIDSTGALTATQASSFSSRLGIGVTATANVQLALTAAASNLALQVSGNGTQSIADFRNGSTSVVTVGNTGQTTFQNSADSTSGLNVKRSTGAGGASVLDVDTQNGRVGVNNATPGYALDVTGSVNVTTGNTYKIAGADICTASGCTASAASAIQNTTTVQTNASLAISSAADANITAYLQGRASQSAATLSIKQGSSQTGDAITIVDGSNNPLFKIDSTGALTETQASSFSSRLGIGVAATANVQLALTAAASNLALQVSGNGTQGIADFRNGSTSVLTLGNTGQTTFQNTSDSTAALDVKKSTGAGGASVFNVDTQNGRIGVNKATPGFAVDVTGDVNVDSASTFKIGGTTVCTINGCIPSAGSNRYIQNATSASLQTGVSFAIQAANDTDVTAYIEGRTSQSASLLQLKGGSTQTGDYIKILTSGNANIFNITSGGDGAIQNKFTVGNYLGVGVAASAGVQLRVTPTTTSTIGLQLDGTTSTAGTSVLEANTANSGSLKYNGAGTMTVTSGTAQTVAVGLFTLANTAGTQTDGLVINRNGTGGTTTNGANITQTNGTLTNGLAFTGAITNDINRASGTLTLNGAGGISLKTNGTQTFSLGATGDALFKNTGASSTAFQVQSSGSVLMLTADTSANQIEIGSASTDTTAVLLILDSYSTLADPTGVEGAMYYNTNSKSFRCYMNTRWRSCVAGVVFANTTVSNSVVSTTAETAFNQNYSIPANDCQPGRVYRITAQGLFSATTTQPTLNLRLKFGTTVLATTGSNAMWFGGTMSNRTWRLEAQITCITASATGTVEPSGVVTMFYGTPSSTQAFSEMFEIRAATPTSPVTVDTTAAQTLQLSAQWSVSSASNSITMRQIVVEASGP